jgi:signal peptidase I
MNKYGSFKGGQEIRPLMLLRNKPVRIGAIVLALLLPLTFCSCAKGQSKEKAEAAEEKVYHLTDSDKSAAIEKFKEGKIATTPGQLAYANIDTVIIYYGAIIVYNYETKEITHAFDPSKFGYKYWGGDPEMEGAYSVYASSNGKKLYFDMPNKEKDGIYDLEKNDFYYSDSVDEIIKAREWFNNFVDTEVLKDAGIFQGKYVHGAYWNSENSVVIMPDTFL